MKKIHAIICILVLLCLAACSPTAKEKPDQKPPEPGTPKVTTPESPAQTPESPAEAPVSLPVIELNEEEKEIADKLKTSVNKNLFPSSEQGKKENARVFLYLAATSKDDALIAASLQGMGRTWTGSETDKTRELADDNYRAVISYYLDSKNPIILGRALDNAKNALGGNDSHQEIVDKLIAIADSHDDASARLEALNALYTIKGFESKEKIADVFLKSLNDKEPQVRTIALFRIMHNTYKLDKKDEFYKKVREMMKDENPGVRGRAAETATILAPDQDKPEIITELLAMLDDKEAYVRSAAANGLARLKAKQAVPKLMGMLDDGTKNTYNISYTKLTGEQGSEHHDGSAWSRINDSALRAINDITRDMGDNKFVYGKIDYKNVEPDIAREAKLCKEWYEKNKDKMGM